MFHSGKNFLKMILTSISNKRVYHVLCALPIVFLIRHFYWSKAFANICGIILAHNMTAMAETVYSNRPRFGDCDKDVTDKNRHDVHHTRSVSFSLVFTNKRNGSNARTDTASIPLRRLREVASKCTQGPCVASFACVACAEWKLKSLR